MILNNSQDPSAKLFIGQFGKGLSKGLHTFLNDTKAASPVPMTGGAGPKSLLGLLFIVLFSVWSRHLVGNPQSVITVAAIWGGIMDFIPTESVKDFLGGLFGRETEEFAPVAYGRGASVIQQTPDDLMKGDAFKLVSRRASMIEAAKDENRKLLAASRTERVGYTNKLARCANGGCSTVEEEVFAQALLPIVRARDMLPQLQGNETALQNEMDAVVAEYATERKRWDIWRDESKMRYLEWKMNNITAEMNATGMMRKIVSSIPGINNKQAIAGLMSDVAAAISGRMSSNTNVLQISEGRRRSGRTVNYKGTSALALPLEDSSREIKNMGTEVVIQTSADFVAAGIQSIVINIPRVFGSYPGTEFNKAALDIMLDAAKLVQEGNQRGVGTHESVDTQVIDSMLNEYLPMETSSTGPRSFMRSLLLESAAEAALENNELSLAPLRAEAELILDERTSIQTRDDRDKVVNDMMRMGWKGTREEAKEVVEQAISITRIFGKRPNKANDLYAQAVMECNRVGGKCPKVKISKLSERVHAEEDMKKWSLLDRLYYALGNIAVSGAALGIAYVGTLSAMKVIAAPGEMAEGIARRLAPAPALQRVPQRAQSRPRSRFGPPIPQSVVNERLATHYASLRSVASPPPVQSIVPRPPSISPALSSISDPLSIRNRSLSPLAIMNRSPSRSGSPSRSPSPNPVAPRGRASSQTQLTKYFPSKRGGTRRKNRG